MHSQLQNTYYIPQRRVELHFFCLGLYNANYHTRILRIFKNLIQAPKYYLNLFYNYDENTNWHNFYQHFCICQAWMALIVVQPPSDITRRKYFELFSRIKGFCRLHSNFKQTQHCTVVSLHPKQLWLLCTVQCNVTCCNFRLKAL